MTPKAPIGHQSPPFASRAWLRTRPNHRYLANPLHSPQRSPCLRTQRPGLALPEAHLDLATFLEARCQASRSLQDPRSCRKEQIGLPAGVTCADAYAPGVPRVAAGATPKEPLHWSSAATAAPSGDRQRCGMGSGGDLGLSHTARKNGVPRSLARLPTPRTHLGTSYTPSELRRSGRHVSSTLPKPSCT